MALIARKLQGGAQDRIRSFVAQHAQSLEPGAYTVRAVMDYGTDVLVAGEVGLVVRK